MTRLSQPRLSLPRLMAYASINIPLSGVGLPIAVYLAPLYAEEVGLGLATTGIIFMLLRGWDIITDPIMGFLVDRYQTRWGRVRHWLALSVPVLAISAWFLYFPGRGEIGAFYLAGWMAIFYVGFTLLQTSQQAWAPALAQDYDERTRLFQWREIFNVVALLSLLALPGLIGLVADIDRYSEVATMGAILIISLPITVGLATAFVPDPPLHGHAGNRPDFSPQALKAALNNPTLWRILGMEVCVGLAIASTAANYLFVAEASFGITSGANFILMLFFVAGFAALPFWMGLSRRTEKHIALRAVLLLSAGTYLIWLPLSQIGGIPTLVAAILFSGIGFGTPFALVRSMLADIIDQELVRTGEDRSGLYYALMTSAFKMGAGLAIGITYPLIGIVVGFSPDGENSEGQVLGLILVFIGVPFVAYLIATLCAWNYPVTRDVQTETRRKLDDQASSVASAVS